MSNETKCGKCSGVIKDWWSYCPHCGCGVEIPVPQAVPSSPAAKGLECWVMFSGMGIPVRVAHDEPTENDKFIWGYDGWHHMVEAPAPVIESPSTPDEGGEQ